MFDFLTFIGWGKKPGGKSRKDFVRTKIPLSENISSIVILVLLAGMGIAIAIKGRIYNPYLYTVRTNSLDATSAPVVGKSQTVPTTEVAEVGAKSADAPKPAATPEAANTAEAAPTNMPSDVGGDGSSPATPPVATQPALPTVPLDLPLDGIKPMSDTEFYTADSLYEKIDGRSPAYQAFNVQQLRCRSFSVNAASGSYVDVYEYRFDTALDAFGMFASERDPKGKPLDFAPDGYSGEMGYFFRQGPVYVQIIASDQKPETIAAATAIAQNRAKTLPVDDTGVAGRRQLPTTGLIADSVTFVAEDAQGQNSLKNVFQAKYNFDGAVLPFFIMVSTPDEANKAWTSFQSFCGSFGKVEQLPDMNGGKVFRAQVFGKWKVVYLRNNELGGVFDATDGEKARHFVEAYLMGNLK